MAKNDRYVVKNDKGWAVKKGGSPRVWTHKRGFLGE